MSGAVTNAQDRVNGLWKAGVEPWQVVRDTLLAAGVLILGVRVIRSIRRQGLKKAAYGLVLGAVNRTTAGQAVIAKDSAKTLEKLRKSIKNPDAANDEILLAIPAKGRTEANLLTMLKRWQASDKKHWNEGQASGTVYHGGDELNAFLLEVYGMFALSNPLHTDIFPFVRKMEAEVVRMTCTLFRGDAGTCGTMTTGGSESILMAMKSYRDEAHARGIMEPEILCGVSAHAAFDKAAHYFKIKIVKVDVNEATMQVDMDKLKNAISSNTVVIVGSAPGFPHGVVDPIRELASLAASRGIGMHVDACLGGYLLPFAVKLGYKIPDFDFSVPGVTSISADTHKYGYAPKGASVIMYRSMRLRSFQYHVSTEWTGGIYASPSLPGSRPGGLVAATWAALVRMGMDGYLQCAKDIMDTARAIEDGIRKIPGLRVLGTPHMSVIAFTADTKGVNGQVLNIFKVGEAMSAKRTLADGSEVHGWNLNTLQRPSAIHLCITYMHRQRAAAFLSDLRAATQKVLDNPHMFRDGTAAIYGLAESLPEGTGTEILEDIARGFIDCVYDEQT